MTIADYPDVKIRMLAVGPSVTVWADGTLTIPSLGRPVVGPANVVPEGFRPAHDAFGALEHRWIGNGAGTLSVDQFGSVAVWNPTSAASGQWAGSVTYVRR